MHNFFGRMQWALVLLWCLLIPFAGSLLSSLGVLNYFIAVLAGWVSATITLPLLYYGFCFYLDQSDSGCVGACIFVNWTRSTSKVSLESEAPEVKKVVDAFCCTN